MSIGTVVAPTLSRRDGGDAVAKDPSRRRRIGGRLWGLDAVRAVATLLVIVIHCDHWPLQSSGADLAVWGGVDTVARVAVPLFVLLSGFLMTHQRQDDVPRDVFLRRRLGRSLLPWLVWTPIYTLIGLYLTQEVPLNWSGVWGWWLLGGGHLWFLVLIPQLYIAFLFWPRSMRGRKVAAVVAVAVQTALCLYRLYAPNTAPLQTLFLGYGAQFLLFWIGYFAVGAALGAWFAQAGRPPPAWPFWLCLPLGAALLLGVDFAGAANASYAQGTGAFLRPTLVPLAVAAFPALTLSGNSLLREHPGLRRPVGLISRYSLAIYIVHEALAYIPGRILAAPLLQQNLPLSAAGFALMTAVTLLLALGVSRVLVATPMAVTLGLTMEPLRGRSPASRARSYSERHPTWADRP